MKNTPPAKYENISFLIEACLHLVIKKEKPQQVRDRIPQTYKTKQHIQVQPTAHSCLSQRDQVWAYWWLCGTARVEACCSVKSTITSRFSSEQEMSKQNASQQWQTGKGAGKEEEGGLDVTCQHKPISQTHVASFMLLLRTTV